MIRCYLSSTEFIETCSGSAFKSATEILGALLACSVSHDRSDTKYSPIDSCIPGKLGSWITCCRHSKECFLDVALLERPLSLRMIRESAGETICCGFHRVHRP